MRQAAQQALVPVLGVVPQNVLFKLASHHVLHSFQSQLLACTVLDTLFRSSNVALSCHQLFNLDQAKAKRGLVHIQKRLIFVGVASVVHYDIDATKRANS